MSTVTATDGKGPPRNRVRKRRYGWKRILGRLLFWSAIVAGSLTLLDWGAGAYQAGIVEAREQRMKDLQRMAWRHLRADLDQVTVNADGRYRVTIWMENLYPEHEMFFMVPSVRGYLQVGPRWQQIPVVAAEDGNSRVPGSVINLSDRIYLDLLLEADGYDGYYEMLEGYMHIRFDNTMYLSPDAEPKDDIVERTDWYYVHLRPPGADVEALARKHRFGGDGAPLFIPMPPH